MTTQSHYQPLMHRTAVTTTVVALLPIAVGAVVTTMKWGMAFRDWPTSDGQNMLSYPWLTDFLRGAMGKFTEHGHRLAGMLIGVVSIGLAAVAWRREPRLWVKLLATGVLLGVIVQGLLGGVRVLRNDPGMAMVHGNFAAIVFCLMASVSLVTSRRWHELANGRQQPAAPPLRESAALKPLAAFTTLAIYAQYILGGRVRHLHDMLHEHLGGAAIAGLFALATIVVAHRSRSPWLKSIARWMLLFLVIQLSLGAGAWITRFGFATVGYVAQPGSPTQMIIRSSHTVVGMLLMMCSVILTLRVVRLEAASRSAETVQPNAVVEGGLTMEGGLG